MKLEKLLDKIDYTLVKGNIEVLVKDIAYDSRNVLDDYAFIALIGNNVDGHEYIDNAIDKIDKEYELVSIVPIIFSLDDEKLTKNIKHLEYLKLF